jgi:hypothetical protein
MKTSLCFALVAALAVFSAAPVAAQAAEPMEATHAAPQGSGPAVSVAAGKMIYDAKGHLIAPVYHVTDGGMVQVILDEHLVTIPAQTLSESQGKVVTSLTKADLMRSAH